MKFNLYRNTLTSATYISNNGIASIGFFNLSIANNGRNDFDVDHVGSVEISEGWEIGESRLGEILFIKDDQCILASEVDFMGNFPIDWKQSEDTGEDLQKYYEKHIMPLYV